MSVLTADDRLILLQTLVAKLAVLVVGALAYTLLTPNVIGSPIGLLEIWDRWDGPHYIDLALLGYRATDPGIEVIDGYRRAYPGDLPLYAVFYPLFPWLASAALAVVRDPVVAVFVVSGIASLVVGPLLYRVVAGELGVEVARTAVLFLLAFPTAYFLHIGYTESLFLALALGSFLAARGGRWWTAGILAGLATLARVNGLLLVPALAAEAYLQWRTDRRWRPEWLAITLVGAGFAGYLALNLSVYGDPFAFLEIQREHWFKRLSPPWEGIGGVVRSILTRPPDDALMLGWMELGFIALGLAGTVYSALRFRLSWTVWMATNWLLFVSTSFVLSVPRYSLVMFPLYAWFAVIASRSRAAGWALGLASVAGLVYFAGRFASGEWAF